MNGTPVIELREVSRTRDESDGGASVAAVSLVIGEGEIVALTGLHGCGRNLLLRLLGLREVPDAGEVLLLGQPTARLTDDARIELRNQRCGYLFSAPFLLPAFNVAENIAMPIFKISQATPEEARDRTEALLRFVGLDAAATQRALPPRLQHRVALARALANRPAALFVEELETLLAPGELPEFRRLLHAAAREYQVAVIFTAAPDLPYMEGERRLEIADGRIISPSVNRA